MVIVAIVVVVILLVAGGYFYIMNKTGDANPITALKKTTASVTLNDKCDYNDPDLCKFINAQAKQTKYEVTMTGTENGEESTSTFTIDGAKTHMVIKAGDQNYNTITIDKTTYTKDPSDNKWWKQTTTDTADTSTADEVKFEAPSATASAEEKTTFTKVGKEACGKLTCFKYTSVTGTDSGSTETLWFDDTQYLLRKMTTTSADGTITMVYAYDNISVTAPSPTKDVADGQMVMPNGQVMSSGGMTQEQIDAMMDAMEQVTDDQ